MVPVYEVNVGTFFGRSQGFEVTIMLTRQYGHKVCVLCIKTLKKKSKIHEKRQKRAERDRRSTSEASPTSMIHPHSCVVAHIPSFRCRECPAFRLAVHGWQPCLIWQPNG